MLITVKNSAPFQILTSAMVIGPSQTGYQLEVAADGRNFSPLFSVGPNVTRQATNLSSGAYYRLNGNVGDVVVNWRTSCVTEGGGGASGTELTPVSEFPAGAEAGTVIAYSGSSSAAGIYQFDGTDWVEAGGNVDLSAYWTSAETQSAITAVEDHLFDVEEVTASALTELHNAVLELSGSSVDLSGYYTSGETDAAISAATAGKADAASVTARISEYDESYLPAWNEQGVITGDSGQRIEAFQIGFNDFYINSYRDYIGSGSMGMFYAPDAPGNAGEILVSRGEGNGAPVWSAVTFPTPDVDKAYVDSAITEVQDQIDTMDDVVSAALVDLNTRKVESTSVSTIWKGTQAEYDAATQSGATANPATLYIIVNNS